MGLKFIGNAYFSDNYIFIEEKIVSTTLKLLHSFVVLNLMYNSINLHPSVRHTQTDLRAQILMKFVKIICISNYDDN